MPTALFINGVFRTTLAEIEKTQQDHPGKICYLQPYASERIKLLAEAKPTAKHPITLHLSLTDSLGEVSYRAKIIGWEDKRDIAKVPTERARLNQHIKEFQPSEGEIYMTVGDGKKCVNLISVVDVERLKKRFPVSYLIKMSDGKPRKERPLSGGWSEVQELPEWLGATEAVKDCVDASLEEAVRRSSKSTAAERQKRLAEAPRKPVEIQVVSRAFLRNPDVIAEVLFLARGKCQECKRSAPFFRKSNGKPYLEVHHIKMLADEGEDTVANAIAICPNCHRRLHFGKSGTPSDH